MQLHIQQNGKIYSIVCLGGVTIQGTDLELLKARAKRLYGLSGSDVSFQIHGQGPAFQLSEKEQKELDHACEMGVENV